MESDKGEVEEEEIVIRGWRGKRKDKERLEDGEGGTWKRWWRKRERAEEKER